MEKRSWRNKIHTDEVFVRVNEEKGLIKTIRQRQKNWIGYMLRGDGLLRDVMEERLNRKKHAGKPRKGVIGDLKQACGQKRTRK